MTETRDARRVAYIHPEHANAAPRTPHKRTRTLKTPHAHKPATSNTRPIIAPNIERSPPHPRTQTDTHLKRDHDRSPPPTDITPTNLPPPPYPPSTDTTNNRHPHPLQQTLIHHLPPQRHPSTPHHIIIPLSSLSNQHQISPPIHIYSQPTPYNLPQSHLTQLLLFQLLSSPTHNLYPSLLLTHI